MYRLLKGKGVHLTGLPELTSTNGTGGAKFTFSGRACELCSQFRVISKNFVRQQSTNTNPSIAGKKPRKKRVRTTKKYAEMLMVTKSSTSEYKATIQNLKPNEIKLLAMTNFNLGELYKLKDFAKTTSGKIVYEHTYNNLTDINNIPYISIPEKVEETPIVSTVIPETLKVSEAEKLVEPEVEVEVEEMTEEVLQSVKVKSAFQPETIEEEIGVEEVVKEEEPEPKRVPRKGDSRAREEVITRTLASYIQTCASLKTPQRGLNAMNFHRYRVGKFPDRFPALKSIVVYNELLKGFAARGDYSKLREVLRIIEQDGVKLNVQSYAAIFECLGRVNKQGGYLKDIRQHEAAAMAAGMTFHTILNNATFLYDQREVVVLAMKAHDPNFKPSYDGPSVQFTNHLVNHLNAAEQLAGFPETVEDSSGIFSRENLSQAIRKQMEIEKNVSVTVRSIEPKSTPTEDVLKFRQTWSDHVKMWDEAASLAFHRDLAALTAQRSALNLEPYFRSIPIKDFIAIITDEAQKLAQGSETYSPTVNMLYRDLGAKVYNRYKVLKKQKAGVLDKIYKIHNKYCDNYADTHNKLDVLPGVVDPLNPRQKWQWAEYSYKHEGATVLMDHQDWVPTTMMAIGKFLYNIVMHDLKIDVNALRNNSKHKNYLPAFYTIFRNQGRLVKEEVKPHPILSKLYRASVPETLSFPAYELPMCCPPVPWTSVQTGGYLVAPCDVVRLPSQATMQKQRLKDATPNELYPSLDALNQLASIPWKVNHNILDVILQVFKSGGSAKLDVPEPPAALTPPPMITQEMEKSEKYSIFRQRLQFRRKKAEMYSLWCDCLYRLSLANHFRDDIFWLPHNMDFRGRVYPVPPHLNHLGSDLARSMLVFAESRPLGPDGLNWLKLHLINLTGMKKRDRIADRLKYADVIMDKILDSADNPLTGQQWWAESDEPWQTLACCIEIAAGHRSPDPEKFESHFPIHQDGSCNGLQHYAALGRDDAGAFSVNLCPSPVPQDVYSAVAVLVEEKRQSDAEKGIEIARALEGFVKRKVIKQTVMTTVYGVTRFGARLQIARQLKDIDNFPKDSVWPGSSYLTARTFESLRTMFTSTREIQDWFTECARLISSVCGENVEWVTPMGLPIVQPYFRYKRLNNQGVYEAFHMDQYEKPNVMKQKNAFPPNFIHSLDSSHMMLTSLHCERAGITFVSVHDCYWTHPSTVHIMNKYCREQFVALHSEPILENLSNFLSEKYSYHAADISDDGSVSELSKKKLNRLLRRLPGTGKFDINEVLKSIYFFS